MATFKAYPLTDDLNLKIYNEALKHYEVSYDRAAEAVSRVAQIIPTTELKMLSIGFGDGLLESKTIAAVNGLNDRRVKKIDAYEANMTLLKHVKTKVERESYWGKVTKVLSKRWNLMQCLSINSDNPQVKMINETVNGDTKFPRSGYDLILVAHVLHHFKEEDRKKLFKRMESSLNPGGSIVVVHTDGEFYGKASEFLAMRKECLKLLQPYDNKFNDQVTAASLFKEFRALKSDAVSSYKDVFYANLNFGKIDIESERFFNLMGLALKADLRKMTKESHEAIRKVVKANSSVEANGDLKLHHPEAIMVFTRILEKEAPPYNLWPLTEDLYLQCNNTVYSGGRTSFDNATEAVVNAITAQKEDNIKFLSIGCGDGQWEPYIIDQLNQACRKKKINHFDAYEPNPTLFGYLSHQVNRVSLQHFPLKLDL